MTQEINRVELIKGLRGLLGFRGSSELSFEEFILPVVDLVSLDAPPYHTKYGGICSVSAGPVAAQYSHVGIGFPIGATIPKGARIIVKWLVIYSAAASLHNFCNAPTNGYGVVMGDSGNVPGSWDSTPDAIQSTDAPRPSARLFNATSAIQGTAGVPAMALLGGALAGPAPAAVYQGPFVIAPGNQIMIQNQTINQQTVVAFYWDEYYLG